VSIEVVYKGIFPVGRGGGGVENPLETICFTAPRGEFPPPCMPLAVSI